MRNLMNGYTKLIKLQSQEHAPCELKKDILSAEDHPSPVKVASL